MIEVLRENESYLVQLDADSLQVHTPHSSWGTYRVLDRTHGHILFETANRDKSFGVFEYLSQRAKR
jgi:hypothetical protein